MKNSVTINGVELEEGDLMTLHVALENFAMDLRDPEFIDGIGERLAEGYGLRIDRLRWIIHKGELPK